jgi:APA family basic amino acid/polyamine antiporter
VTSSQVGSHALVRGLGLAAAASVVVGNVIGTGVFLKARVMTCNLGSPGLVLAAWVAAGLLSVAGALAYAELAAMMPHAGGDYVFLREAYGSRWASLYGWMQTAIGFTGSMAAKAAAFAIFLNVMLGGALERTYFTLALGPLRFPFGSLQVVALATIVVVTLVNFAAVSVTGGLSVVLSGLKVAIVLAIGAGTFAFATGDWGTSPSRRTAARATDCPTPPAGA